MSKKNAAKKKKRRAVRENRRVEAAPTVDEKAVTPNGPEIVIGLLGAVGTDMPRVCSFLRASLKTLLYESEEIHLIDGVLQFERWHQCPQDPIDLRIEAQMKAGSEFREELGRNDAFALLAIAQIRKTRLSLTEDVKTPSKRTAYIIRSLKTPEEISRLREVYGKSFFAIAAYSPRKKREKNFAQRIASSNHVSIATAAHSIRAIQLIDTDELEAENRPNGQNLRKAFPEADFFVDASVGSAALRSAIDRILELLFGNFRHTPTKEEVGMFHAFGAAVRSSSLARQVGAAICTKEGDLVSIGCNEVPKAFGGCYWAGDENDGRDHILEADANDTIKRDLLIDLFKRMKGDGWLDSTMMGLSDKELLGKALDKRYELRKAQLMNITEYGRAVHAEMAALTDAARRGISVLGCTLYTTTFPCHNCAKHIIASGISKVVYLEPYPKSFAQALYADSVGMDLEHLDHGRVPFLPFVGISHRQFFQLFQMGESERKSSDGKVIPWPLPSLEPRFHEYHVSYIEKENTFLSQLDEVIQLKQLNLHENIGA